jgi:hypothetical protein
MNVMTFDPYTNRIPHGLLTDEERAALKATGGPWECRDPDSGKWVQFVNPKWFDSGVYRAVRKPLPVPQDGDVWVRFGASPYFFLAEPKDEHEAERIIAEGYRLFREVRA